MGIFAELKLACDCLFVCFGGFFVHFDHLQKSQTIQCLHVYCRESKTKTALLVDQTVLQSCFVTSVHPSYIIHLHRTQTPSSKIRPLF